nr:zinc finger CCCH domain-containing protein 18 isoform X1 [Tanacetum cinerariifolium]
MDFSESTKVVYNRIQKLEPENVSKIIGYLLLQDHGEREMIRLALGPDNLIHLLISKAKNHLSLPSSLANSTAVSPPGVNSVSSMPITHGNSCRYSHGNPIPELFSPFSPDSYEGENVFLLGSLEKLEMELIELLKSRRGFPVSIASLPMLYYEKFGKTLQAEGYLTESQRHGKAGYSLTKLLARLKRITLIDRPHGQHSVILADEITKYMDYNGDRNEQGGIVAGSRQIYLTFPAESTFTEQDVSNYFKKFGPVQDVRIPSQQKRMFGFVTFAFGETVRNILNKGNPHFICSARVLVKPYREKYRDDRKVVDKFRHSMYYGAHSLDRESELPSMSRICDNSTSPKKKLLIEEQLAGCRYSLEELQLSEGNTGQMDYSSTERFGHLFDAWNNGSARDEGFRQISTKYTYQE